MLWWCEGGNGYTTDLRKAATYAKDAAERMHDTRETDIPWPKEYIDARTRPAVDMQYIDRSHALLPSNNSFKPTAFRSRVGVRVLPHAAA